MKYTNSLFILLPAAAALSFMSPVTHFAQANDHTTHINMHNMVNEHNMVQIHLQNYNDNRDNWSFQSRQDKQSQLKDLLREHAVVGAITFIKIYDNSSDADSYRQKVDSNTQRLTDMIGKMMGNNKKEEFRSLWQEHIDMLTAYTNAKRDNNDNDQQNAMMNMDDMSNRLASFFSNGNSSQDDMKNMFKTHMDQEKSIIDAHDAGDNDQMRQLLKEADMHAAMMADRIMAMQGHVSNEKLTNIKSSNGANNANVKSDHHNDGDHDQDDD